MGSQTVVERNTGPAVPLAVALAAAMLAIAVSLAFGLREMPLDPGGSPADGKATATQSYGKLPLTFVPNRGQTDASVRYQAQGPGFGFYFSDEKITLDLVGKERGVALELRFAGANPDARLEALHRQPGKVNYLMGDRRQTNIPTYTRLRYRELWPGIDMVMRGTSGRLKYEFRLAPGADPKDIRLAYAGASSLSVSEGGSLLVGTSLGTLKDTPPVTYQPLEEGRRPVASRYSLGTASAGYGFHVGAYDHGRPLVIDPGLEYSTFIGPSWTRGLEVDGAGNTYITGETKSSGYPTTPGAYDTNRGGYDAFVTKLNASGSALVYSTFIGGELQQEPDFDNNDGALGIDIDGAGNAYVTGYANSPDFPVTPGAYRATGGPDSVFAAKLNPTGSALVYSTFLGRGNAFPTIAVDGQGNAYVAGGTSSSSFPTTPAAYDPTFNGDYDVYVVKLNPTGSSALFSTFIGGANSGESAGGIALDGQGNAYLTGLTFSPGASGLYPATPGAFDTTANVGTDAFVTKLSSNGTALLYSTYLGQGMADDNGWGIAVDSANRAYVAGFTSSSSFPVTPGAYATSRIGNAFVTKFNETGSALAYSTYMSGGVSDIALDAQGNAYVVGALDSAEDLDATPNGHDQTANGNFDAYVAELSANGSSLLYATYLGGSAYDAGADIAVAQGRTYVAGSSRSADFPTTPGAYDTTFSGTFDPPDVFVSKLDTSIYGYARPKGASPKSIRLVPAYKACSSPNASHGEPFTVGSCNPPVQASDFLTVGSPDSNGNAANSVGLLQLKAVGESPIDLTNGDQSDIEISFSITDVRRRGDFADYLGEVKVTLPIRLTDRNNGPTFVHPATATDATLSFIVNCIPTSGTSTGSACSSNTTADAVMPGITPEFKRAVWQLGQIQIYDGGSDGDADDNQNTLFAVPGLFVP